MADPLKSKKFFLNPRNFFLCAVIIAKRDFFYVHWGISWKKPNVNFSPSGIYNRHFILPSLPNFRFLLLPLPSPEVLLLELLSLLFQRINIFRSDFNDSIGITSLFLRGSLCDRKCASLRKLIVFSYVRESTSSYERDHFRPEKLVR